MIKSKTEMINEYMNEINISKKSTIYDKDKIEIPNTFKTVIEYVIALAEKAVEKGMMTIDSYKELLDMVLSGNCFTRKQAKNYNTLLSNVDAKKNIVNMSTSANLNEQNKTKVLNAA